MPLEIVRNDITKMKVDAIVNAANHTLLGGGGVDGAIHRAAGPKLLAECLTLGGCETGNAKITGAYRLPCKYVIHTVGPRWRGGTHGEHDKLISCYRTSLALAKENKCESVAFPLISSGIYGYPKDKALKVALDTIRDFLFDNEMTVYLVIYDKAAYQISEKLFRDIAEYIDDHYVEEHTDSRYEQMRSMQLDERELLRNKRGLPREERGLPREGRSLPRDERDLLREEKGLPRDKKDLPRDKGDLPRKGKDLSREEKGLLLDERGLPRNIYDRFKMSAPAATYSQIPIASTLDEAVSMIDESFSEMLMRKIDERGLTDAQCYRKANIDRKLFSKIRSDKFYKPSKPTVLAFAIALELPLSETREMLMKAGFALSHSNKFDIIVEFFISRGNYNIFEINEALFAFDQNLLGA